jgi:uncharacterized membrane protein
MLFVACAPSVVDEAACGERGEAGPGPASITNAKLDAIPLMASQPEDMLGPKNEIAVSSEMIAVMDALTPRERSIVETLIKRGGRMIQAEIRYETNLPRSTLTTILVSLERRGLITKREWGRTNVVELSERFLSGKERL